MDQPAGFLSLKETEFSALETLKTALIQLPVLAQPNANEHSTFDTDARDVQVRIVPLQQQHVGRYIEIDRIQALPLQ